MNDALARAVTKYLGGDWRGRRGLAPGPGHTGHDRSLSVKAHSSDPDDVVLYSFAGDDVLAIKDDLRRAGVLPRKDFRTASHPAAKAAVERPVNPQPDQDDKEERRRRAIRLWRPSVPIEGTAAEAYLRTVRGIEMPLPSTLRCLPANPRLYPWAKMIAAYGIAREDEPGVITIPEDLIAGIHCTELLPDGSGKAPVDPVRWTRGPVGGWPIVLAPINDGLALAVAEGIETALAVAQDTSLGVWAAGPASFMPALAEIVPRYVECVSVYGENDSGKSHAAKLINGLLERGFEVRLCEVKDGLA
jgi:hypothetical protein